MSKSLLSKLQAVVASITFFFFQAEDGIRDYKVTGVQTCALPIAVGAFVADSSRSDQADHTSNLFVRRLDVKDPAIRAVILDRQEYPRVSHGPCHPAAPRSDEARRALDRGRGRQARAAGDERREGEDGSSVTRVHADGVRRPDAGWTV